MLRGDFAIVIRHEEIFMLLEKFDFSTSSNPTFMFSFSGYFTCRETHFHNNQLGSISYSEASSYKMGEEKHKMYYLQQKKQIQ